MLKFTIMKRYSLIIALVLFRTCLFSQESNTLSTAEKIYGLSKFWKEVSYNFPYFDLVPKLKWDSAYRVYIPKVLATKTDFEYYNVLLEFDALLKDGHTRVKYPNEYYSKMSATMFGDYQLYIESIEDKAIIIRVNASKKHEIPIGSEIIEVNGKPTEDYLKEEIFPTTAASTDFGRRDWSVKGMLWGFYGDKFNLKIKTPSGEIKYLALIIQKSEEKEYFPPFDPDELLAFKWMDDEIAYVKLNAFTDAKIDTLFIEKLPELKRAKGLILDVRTNGGGNSGLGDKIAKYLIEDTCFYESRTKTRKNIADYKAIAQYITIKETDTVGDKEATDVYLCSRNKLFEDRGVYKVRNDIPMKDKIIVPTVILMGHGTASAAETFLLCFDKSKHIIKMGEYSNGSTGMKYFFNLPGGGRGEICIHNETYPDGRSFVGCGVKPDIEVTRTIDDLVNNRDRALEEAISYLKKKM